MKSYLAALATLFIAVAATRAQSPPATDIADAPTPALTFTQPSADRIWFQSEYLLWWVKKAPVPTLVTTGPYDPNTFTPGVTPVPGGFNSPGTANVLGGNGSDLGAFSGFRLSLGAWLDSENNLGVEVGGLMLARRSATASARSDSQGNPFLGVPFTDANTGKNNILGIAFPNDAANTIGGLAGTASVTTTLQLWGAEANMVGRLYENQNVKTGWLFGFRTMTLDESLTLQTKSTPFGQPVLGGFGFSDVPIGQNLSTYDRFETRNRFYGGQIGGKMGIDLGRVELTAVGKVALGCTEGKVSVNGTTSLDSGTAVSSLPGGVLAVPSNIGTQTHHTFSVVPEVTLGLKVHLTERVSLLASYNYLYWTGVLRPGDQIDHHIDQRSIPSFGGPGNYMPGLATTSPAPGSQRSDFFAHGVNLGLEFKF